MVGTAIELRHVTVTRGERLILKDVNLQVPTGSCCAIIGPNGAGKSAMVAVLAGFMWPTSGEVLVTHHLDELPRSVDRVVLLKGGKVFESGSPDQVLTSDSLCRLFDCRVTVVRQDGRFVASATHGAKSWT